MKKVVFLDRDGVINEEIGDYVYRIEDFKLNSGLELALTNLSHIGYSFAIITNQGGISKQLYRHSDVQLLNIMLINWFNKRNLNLIEILYCPHHPIIESCICRKPNSGMLEKIIAKHQVSINNSFLIGDQESDIIAAKKIGLRFVKINSNTDLNKIKLFHD